MSEACVALDNFPKDSTNVVFTERASIEAIKRLGFKDSDFNYHSLKEFRKPGMDEAVAKMLFQKSQERRERMIEEALRMRQSVLNERIQKSRSAPTFQSHDEKHGKTLVETDERNFNDLKAKNEAELKRLVVINLRKAFQADVHRDAVERAEKFSNQFAQRKSEETQAIINRGLLYSAPITRCSTPVKISRPCSRLSDNSETRLAELRKSEELKRKQISMRRDERAKSALAKSQKLHAEHMERTERLVTRQQERFTGWQKKHEVELNEKARASQERAAHNEKTYKRSLMIEKERLKRTEAKINNAENRTRYVVQQMSDECTNRIDMRKNLYEERVQKARDKEAARKEGIERYRDTLDKRDQEREQRLLDQQHTRELKIAEGQFERKERLEQIGRKRAAGEYAKIRSQATPKQVAMSEANTVALEERRFKIAEKREIEQKRHRQQRNRVMTELENWNFASVDAESIDRLQDLLGIGHAEMVSLIEQAKRNPRQTKSATITRPTSAAARD